MCENALFYPNQIEAGDKIFNEFNREIRQCCLIANLQSGKTGTFQYVIQKMLGFGLVKKVIIMSGMNDNDLKDQAIKDTTMYNPDYFSFIEVKFNRDLKKIHGLKDTLVVLDESHFGSTLGQKVDECLERNGIAVDGNDFKMHENNNYILTVSATPFAEWSDFQRGKNQNKEVIFLKSSEGYIGIRDFYEAGQIYPMFDIKKNRDKFIRLLRDNKYYIGRFDKRAFNEDQIKSLCDEAGAKMIVFAQSSSMSSFVTKLTQINDMMAEAPEQPTVIVIKGKLRAGCVLSNKQHIGWIWENSASPKTDTIMQGLMGRCCGYNSHIHIQMYVSEKLFEGEKNEIRRYIDMLNEERVVPQRGNHMIALREQKRIPEEEFNFTSPAVMLDMKVEMNELGLSKDNLSLSEHFRKMLVQKFKEEIERQRVIGAITDDFFEYVIEYLNDYLVLGENKHITFRKYVKEQYRDEPASIMKFVKSYVEKTPYRGNQGETDKGNKFLTIAVVFPDYNITTGDDVKGKVYYVLRTKFSPNILLADTKKDEIFYPRTHSEEEKENGCINGPKQTQDWRDNTSQNFVDFIYSGLNWVGCPDHSQPFDDSIHQYIVRGTTHQEYATRYFKARGFKIDFKYKRGRRDKSLAEQDKVISRVIISCFI